MKQEAAADAVQVTAAAAMDDTWRWSSSIQVQILHRNPKPTAGIKAGI